MRRWPSWWPRKSSGCGELTKALVNATFSSGKNAHPILQDRSGSRAFLKRAITLFKAIVRMADNPPEHH